MDRRGSEVKPRRASLPELVLKSFGHDLGDLESDRPKVDADRQSSIRTRAYVQSTRLDLPSRLDRRMDGARRSSPS